MSGMETNAGCPKCNPPKLTDAELLDALERRAERYACGNGEAFCRSLFSWSATMTLREALQEHCAETRSRR